MPFASLTPLGRIRDSRDYSSSDDPHIYVIGTDSTDTLVRAKVRRNRAVLGDDWAAASALPLIVVMDD